MAAAAVPRLGSVTGPRTGITVSSVTDSLSPLHLMAKEPIGKPPKDVLSQEGMNHNGV